MDRKTREAVELLVLVSSIFAMYMLLPYIIV
jgi:hypothetical protein